MKQRKNLTATAGIMNIIAYIINILVTGYSAYITFILILALFDLGGETTSTGYLQLIIMAVSVGLKIILSFVSIGLSAKALKLKEVSAKEYDAKKSKIKAIIVINFILIALSAVAPVVLPGLGLSLVGDLFVGPIVITVAILLIVALSKNKKLLQEELNAPSVADSPIVTSAPDASVTETSVINANETKIEQLERLSKMKDAGYLSDEEYNKIKADILK